MRKYYVWLPILSVLFLTVFYLFLSLWAYAWNIGVLTQMYSVREDAFNNSIVKLNFPDKVEEFPLSAVSCIQRKTDYPPFWLFFFKKPTEEVTVMWNEESVRQKVLSLYKEPIDASLYFDENLGWQLTRESDSRSFNVDGVVKAILLQEPGYSVYVDVLEYMQLAEKKYESYEVTYSELSKYNDFVITYTDGTKLTGLDIFSSFEDPLNASVTDYDLSGIKASLLSSYDTSNKTVDFTTTAGDIIRVQYETFGKRLNWEKEEQIIRDAIASCESIINREPSLSGYDTLAGSYVEVSLDNQHVWHYVDGELCCEADCITGTKNRRDTPTGVYYVSERIPGKYLTGDNYKTWVNQWMRLTNSGVGLHDAYWRSKFGGNIYTYDGSHGCINLPPIYAKKLFNELTNGYPVIIY